ncbi:MAG: hypothetical protein RLZZ435_1074 [Cyanobacteriota bacterium]|jgi:hypothetical protein
MSNFPSALTFFLDVEVSYFKDFKDFAGGVEPVILMHILIKHAATANPIALKHSDLLRESGFSPWDFEDSMQQLLKKKIVKRWVDTSGKAMLKVNLNKIASFAKKKMQEQNNV